MAFGKGVDGRRGGAKSHPLRKKKKLSASFSYFIYLTHGRMHLRTVGALKQYRSPIYLESFF